MEKIVQWDSVRRDAWAYEYRQAECSYIIYKLTGLPDFTESRFEYLCKENDDRQGEVAKKQLSMIRQLHSLGREWGISLRFIKKEKKITLYFVFRYAGNGADDDVVIQNAVRKIDNSLLKNEYTFKRIESDEELKMILDLSWATEAAEITKNEVSYQSAEYPDGSRQTFYVPYSWTATDNSMENLCQAMMNQEGAVCADVTLIPTSYLDDEKMWMNENISRLKDSMNGETLKSETGKILWKGPKLPILKTPVDNCEKMNKQYEGSRMFLSSIRVFTEKNADMLAHAFMVNSTRSEGVVQTFHQGYPGFDIVRSAFEKVDVSADIHTRFWNQNANWAPYRAQRLTRLNSVEEIANFFRIPIPIRPGFPGFDFDTGLDVSKSQKKAKSIITLGRYIDDAHIADDAASFDSQQFAKHGLIVGVPGSGKTTAMFNILYQLWAVPDEQKIPFIILEPAKTEYRALKLLDVFRDDMLVFSLGDESVSPFRFNPMEVLPGVKLESHISKLQACFVGAFDLFDPLPIFLEQAIRRTYQEKGWFADSVGGEEGVETPTLDDLCRSAEYIVSHSGFDAKMRSDFQASLLERLNSLRRGSKGRMLNTRQTIPIEELMHRPVVLELDSLNGDEKSLMMMFLLSYVFEYCKVHRKSGSPLKHLLIVEEAHNLIGASGGSENRADPRAKTIELFVNMLAEMRALGQGLLIADQLPTAIASQAVKQTNVKILMRMTAKDDREEIGNTMDLNEEQMHQVVNFKTGHAYLYHEGEDRVRAIRMLNFKGEHDVEEPPSDEELKEIMADYEAARRELFMPFRECSRNCSICNRRVRNQAESFIQTVFLDSGSDPYRIAFKHESSEQIEKYRKKIGICKILRLLTLKEMERIRNRYGVIGDCFGGCVYVHLLNKAYVQMINCKKRCSSCSCTEETVREYFERFMSLKGEE